MASLLLQSPDLADTGSIEATAMEKREMRIVFYVEEAFYPYAYDGPPAEWMTLAPHFITRHENGVPVGPFVSFHDCETRSDESPRGDRVTSRAVPFLLLQEGDVAAGRFELTDAREGISPILLPADVGRALLAHLDRLGYRLQP